MICHPDNVQGIECAKGHLYQIAWGESVEDNPCHYCAQDAAIRAQEEQTSVQLNLATKGNDMITFSDINARVEISRWVKTEGAHMYESEGCIDWDIVHEDDILGMLIDMFTGADSGHYLSTVLDDSCSVEISKALLCLAFRGTIVDSAEAQKIIYDAFLFTLKDTVDSWVERYVTEGW